MVDSAHENKDPSPWVTRFAPMAPKLLPVLDVACGDGRHTRYFRKRGLRVTATDIDLAGIMDLDSDDGVELINRDLEDGSIWAFGTQTFGTVVVTNYLHRPLLSPLVATVAHGGILIYETFALGNEAHGGPSNPDYLLRAGELIDMVRGKLQIVAYEHGRIEHPAPAVVQRICAINGGLPYPVVPKDD